CLSTSVSTSLTTRWSCNNTSQKFAANNPATGETITTVQVSDKESVHEAVLSAHKAFETDWRWCSPAERSALLFACAAALESHKEEIAALLCHENGKPYLDVLSGDVSFVIGVFRYFASLVDKLPRTHLNMSNTVVSVYHEPYGVCAEIVPFNWPPIHTGGKTAPAIGAGNTIIPKPAEQAPLTLLRIVDIINEVFPSDVVQVVPGLGHEVSQALVAHPLVKMVSFTGSSPVGAQVSAVAGKAIKPGVLDLGGKNAFMVFDDADNRRAQRHPDFSCREESLLMNSSCQNGYFVAPTLIADIPPSHVLAIEEIFGPVATATPFDTETEAIDIGNSSEYGLTTCVVGCNHKKCLFARRVNVGMSFINSYTRSVLGTPFGGTKDSGYGREHSIETLRAWAKPKAIREPSGMGELPEWGGHSVCI
ncbi:hypothetical protein N7540_005596, partial [Penicillium herquei]